jgi:hypothetical protein
VFLLPRRDGEPIEEEALVNIREAFKAEGVVFQWKPQDLLLLDNMLISHSRNPYKGERKILVSMANPYSTTAKVQSATAQTVTVVVALEPSTGPYVWRMLSTLRSGRVAMGNSSARTNYP